MEASGIFVLSKNDGEIHYLKSGEVASDAREVVTVEAASILPSVAEGDEECEDPFAGLKKDEEELEDN